MADYSDVEEWMNKLNEDNNWKTLAKKIRLNYNKVKALGKIGIIEVMIIFRE